MAAIKLAIVGDLLMWDKQILACQKGTKGYDFNPVFREVVPCFEQADLVIGNLETTLSGVEKRYQKKQSITGYPLFNCPDAFADALKKSGFSIVTTANNHCLDRGLAGLIRTAHTLERRGIRYVGTTPYEQGKPSSLWLNEKGLRVVIFSYTYGTNVLATNPAMRRAVSWMDEKKMRQEVRQARSEADVILVFVHFGQEFQTHPSWKQKRMTEMLWYAGADAVIGTHPHVMQPIVVTHRKDRWGKIRKRFVAYSLGNFTSKPMWENPKTTQGGILMLTFSMPDRKKSLDINYRMLTTQCLLRKIKGTWDHRVILSFNRSKTSRNR